MVCEHLLLLNSVKEFFSTSHFPLNKAPKRCAAPLNSEYEHSLLNNSQE